MQTPVVDDYWGPFNREDYYRLQRRLGAIRTGREEEDGIHFDMSLSESVILSKTEYETRVRVMRTGPTSGRVFYIVLSTGLRRLDDVSQDLAEVVGGVNCPIVHSSSPSQQ